MDFYRHSTAVLCKLFTHKKKIIIIIYFFLTNLQIFFVFYLSYLLDKHYLNYIIYCFSKKMPLYHKYINCLLIFCLLNIFERCCQCWDSEIHVGGLTFSLILPEKSKHLVAPEIYYDLCHPPPPLPCLPRAHLSIGPLCQQTSLSNLVTQTFAISCCLLALLPGVQMPFKLCPDHLQGQYDHQSFLSCSLSQFAGPEPSGFPGSLGVLRPCSPFFSIV